MSRLDSFIRRLTAQRTCLDYAATLISGKPGVVLELGLGNGRTFDHLRSQLPGHEIFVFDRQVAAHPDCIPDEHHLFLGDFRDTLVAAHDRLGASAVLIHGDIGSGQPDADQALAAAIAAPLGALLAPGGILITDQPIPLKRMVAVPLPDGVPPGRYHMMRKPA